MAIAELLHAKMSLESKWNAMYTESGVYSIEMKDIEKKIEAIKQALVLADIREAKAKY
jgi:hypothetical protein|tara:strand:- start:135 stop:308 length:174 start_codon:yes stop_codon:yes gene_type:complete